MGRGVVKVDSGMARQPPLGGLVLVNIQVIHDHMEIAIGAGGNDGIHELQEVHRGAPLPHLRQDLTAGNLQGRQQCRGAARLDQRIWPSWRAPVTSAQ